MQNPVPKSYYLFCRNSSSFLVELFSKSFHSEDQKFEIWEHLNKEKIYDILIVYGDTLPETFCFQKKLSKFDEKVFNEFYLDRQKDFEIYSAN
jgi:hypothetical protein